MVGSTLRNRVETNLGKIGSLDLFISIAYSPKAHLHIRLSAAQPDISDEDIVKLDRRMALDGHRVGPAGMRRMNLYFPAAVSSSYAGCVHAANLHLNFVAGVRPTPDGVYLATLQHHVVTKDRTDERKRMDGRPRNILS